MIGIPIVGVFGVWRELLSKHPHPWIPVEVCAGMAILYTLIYLLARRTARGGRRCRVVVDLHARLFRFEQCTIHPHLRWPRSTGPGLDIPFDEVLSAKLSTLSPPAILSLTTSRGTINLSDRLTNFHGLAAVAVTLADSPPRPSRVLMTLALLIPAFILTGAIFQLGIWLKWW